MVTARTTLIPRLPGTAIFARGFFLPICARGPPDTGTFFIAVAMRNSTLATEVLPSGLVPFDCEGSPHGPRPFSGYSWYQNPVNGVRHFPESATQFPLAKSRC